MVDEVRISELPPTSSEAGTIQAAVIQESDDNLGLDNYRAEIYSVETIDRLEQESIDRDNTIEQESIDRDNTIEQESIDRDSALDKRINDVNADLNLEAEARWQGDVLLALAIDDEEQARIEADLLLQSNIDDEVQARTEADTALDLRIDGVIDDLGDVSQALGQEVQDRIDGDTALGERIDTETQQRQQDVSDVNDRINYMYSNDMVNTFDDQSINGTKSFEKIQSQTDEVISDKHGNSVLLSTDEHNTFGQDYKHVRLRGLSVPKWVHADGEVDNLATEQQVLDETQARIEADNALASDISDNTDSISQNASDISDLQTGKEDSISYGPSGYMALVNEDGDGFQFVTPPDFSFFRLRGIMTEYTGPDDTIIAEITGDSLNDFLYKDTAPNVAVETPNGFAYRAQENFSAEITDDGGFIDITIGDFLFWNSDVDQWLHLPTVTVEGGVDSINNLAGVINFQAGTGLDIVVNAIDNTVTFLIDDTVATDSDIQALQSQVTANYDQIIEILEDLVYVTGKLIELEASIGDNTSAISALTTRVAQNESNIETLFEDFSAHIDNLNNPHSVTAAQVGAATTGALAAHTGDTDNPHSVTAAQVGAATTGALNAHVTDETNPHAVTADQVGAAPASHVTDETNPHNVTAAQVGAASEEDLAAHVGDTANPHAVTATQVGAAPASHVTDTTNPHTVTAAQVGAATTGALAAHTGDTENPHSVTAGQIGAATSAALTAHTGNTENPHEVTPGQIGAATSAALTAHSGDVGNPHSVTAAQVGAATTGALAAHTGDTENPHSITPGQIGAATTAALTAHTGATDNPHGVTAAQAGAAPASHATDTGNPHGVTAAQVGAATTGALTTHAGLASSQTVMGHVRMWEAPAGTLNISTTPSSNGGD